MPRSPAVRIIDSGCGTGYYLSRVLSERADASALALDASPAAVSMAVTNSSARSTGLVADVWSPLPVRSGIADAVLCVFAPRDASEFARVLVPEGRLLVVTPRENHLQELRASGAMIGIQPDKLGALDDALAAEFALGHREALEYTIDLDVDDQLLAAAMGPSGHHERTVVPVDSQVVTVAVDLSVYTVR